MTGLLVIRFVRVLRTAVNIDTGGTRGLVYAPSFFTPSSCRVAMCLFFPYAPLLNLTRLQPLHTCLPRGLLLLVPSPIKVFPTIFEVLEPSVVLIISFLA